MAFLCGSGNGDTFDIADSSVMDFALPMSFHTHINIASTNDPQRIGWKRGAVSAGGWGWSLRDPGTTKHRMTVFGVADLDGDDIGTTGWHGIGFTVSAAGAWSFWTNGVAAGTGSGLTAGTNDTGDFMIGTSQSSDNSRGTGTLTEFADWAKWNVLLDAAQMAALGKGYSAAFFPNGRQIWIPGIRDYVELQGDVAITESGTNTRTPGPRIIYPTSVLPVNGIVGAGAPAGSALPQIVSSQYQMAGSA